MLKAIIWDMDGTLIDSEELWGEATFLMSEKMGKRLTPEQRLQTVGTNFSFTFKLCATNAGLDPEKLDMAEWKNFMYSAVIELMHEHLEIRSGVTALLKEANAAKIPMAIATNTERVVAETPLDILGRTYFTEIICGDDVPAPKPAPDMYVKAAHLLGVTPKECLVFEDSQAGMTGALAAGCTVIGLPADPEFNYPAGVIPMRSLSGTINFEDLPLKEIQHFMATH